MLFGGTTAAERFQDTWIWNGLAWRKLDLGIHPPARFGGTLTWDPIRNGFVLYGGFGVSAPLGDAWFWNGSAWRELAALTGDGDGPAGRGRHTMVYDTERKRHVLFGGFLDARFTYPLSDTWLLYLRGGGCKSGSECGSGFCTDGVCCESSACGTCETCAGTNTGRCTPVSNADDPDTCSSKNQKTCDKAARCAGTVGTACTTPAECATGLCVGGKCVPASACTNSGEFVDSTGKVTSCGAYVCQEGGCRTTCRNVDDCKAPTVCSDSKCILVEQPPAGESGCCATTPGRSAASSMPPLASVLGVLCTMLVTRMRRRQRNANTSR
jgi:hypothetical protein